MRVEDYPCHTCWMHAEEYCAQCDPDTWFEDLEARDWLLEKGPLDFAALRPPSGRDGDVRHPDTDARDASRHPECERRTL